jgi:hypothetical protein
MDAKHFWVVNWTTMFLVTACSSFIFSIIVKLLDGNFSLLLIMVGIISLGLGVFSWCIKRLTQNASPGEEETAVLPVDKNT